MRARVVLRTCAYKRRRSKDDYRSPSTSGVIVGRASLEEVGLGDKSGIALWGGLAGTARRLGA